MASKRMDLKKNCCFIMSGLKNPLGKILALETCRRFAAGSLALLIDTDEELLQEVKKDIEYINGDVEVMCCPLSSWQEAKAELFQEVLHKALESFKDDQFKLAFIVHNEGFLATRDLMEPQDLPEWQLYMQEHLLAPVALNRQFMQHPFLQDTEKLIVNISSSLPVQPMFFSSCHGSCLSARNMYFRSLPFEEARCGKVSVLTYSPGIFESHQPQTDPNNNVIDLPDLKVEKKLLQIPRVKPFQSALKLINILEETSFISGHDVDYYDTFVL